MGLQPGSPVRLAAVSYLNTVPLIWGMVHGPQRDNFTVSFDVPSSCARDLQAGRADIGIVPVAEVWRNQWQTVPGCGIACRGAVRTILLVSRRPWSQVRTLAADSGSRSSVVLSRVVLARRYGAEPAIIEMEPSLGPMLEAADAALLIGDAALRVDLDTLRDQWLDLGSEWMEMTGLPMVFATWSGPEVSRWPWLAGELAGSLEFGLRHMDDIVRAESAGRGFAPNLVRKYLTEHIVFRLGDAEQQGLERFLEYAKDLDLVGTSKS